MKAEELNSYRDNDGYIDYSKFEEEKGNGLETIDEDRGSGSRDKKWVTFEDTRVMLRNDQFEKDGAKFTTYQELIFEELAKQVNVPTAHYDLIKRDGKKGVLTYNVVDQEENKGLSMYSLADFMGEIGIKNQNFNYNITDAYDAIKNYCKKMNIDKEQYSKAMVDFTKMQVLDLFLSSTDRHPENISFLYGVDEKTNKWGIKNLKTGKVVVPCVYDHISYQSYDNPQYVKKKTTLVKFETNGYEAFCKANELK